MTKYPSQKIHTIITFSVIGSLWIFVSLLEPRSENWLLAIIAFILFLVFFVGGFTWGSYGVYAEKTVTSVQFFVFQKRISAREITWIAYRPTWKFQEWARSVYIVKEINGTQVTTLEFKNSIFSEETLAKLIRDLKKDNPAIILDEHAQELIQKFR